jgi:hypothetical protein
MWGKVQSLGKKIKEVAEVEQAQAVQTVKSE